MLSSLSLRVLRLFGEMRSERVDLHALFEAGGNVPEERRDVLDAIDELIRRGMLKECGSDFYELTESGKRAMAER